MPVNKISDYKPLFKLAAKRGYKVHAVVCHPETLVPLVRAIALCGENPFPNCQRTWRRLWRKPDMRPFLYGVPVVGNLMLERGRVGVASMMPFPPDLSEMFAGSLRIELPAAEQNQVNANHETPVPASDEPGATAMLAQSVNRQDATLSDLMFKAMESVDTADGLIILRYFGGHFDVTTSYNPLEVQTVLQRTMMFIAANGIKE